MRISARQNYDKLLDEFQPDAVEIENRSVPGGVRWTLYAVIGLIIACVAWSCWAEVDQIVVAQGKLITTVPPVLIDTKLASPIRDDQGSIRRSRRCRAANWRRSIPLSPMPM